MSHKPGKTPANILSPGLQVIGFDHKYLELQVCIRSAVWSLCYLCNKYWRAYGVPVRRCLCPGGTRVIGSEKQTPVNIPQSQVAENWSRVKGP